MTGSADPLAACLIVKTTAAHSYLRQQKIMLANRLLPGQPIATNNKKTWSRLTTAVIRLNSSIKQAGNRSDSILKLLIEKPCYNS
jgi:hypothetical protein